jgi:DNA-binding GntR family transcriptional regulator
MGLGQRESPWLFVTTFSSPDVSEVYDIRTALEVLAMRLALAQISDGALEDAQRALSRSIARSSPAATEPKSVG